MLYYIQKVKENTNKTRKGNCMTYTKNIVDANLRSVVFDDLLDRNSSYSDLEYVKVNDRQYGVILTDLNGVERYVRIGAIVAEEREDMTARELMESEIAKYNEAQVKKAEKKRKSEEKAAKDKVARAKKAKEEAEKDDPNQYLDREIAV